METSACSSVYCEDRPLGPWAWDGTRFLGPRKLMAVAIASSQLCLAMASHSCFEVGFNHHA